MAQANHSPPSYPTSFADIRNEAQRWADQQEFESPRERALEIAKRVANADTRRKIKSHSAHQSYFSDLRNFLAKHDITKEERFYQRLKDDEAFQAAWNSLRTKHRLYFEAIASLKDIEEKRLNTVRLQINHHFICIAQHWSDRVGMVITIILLLMFNRDVRIFIKEFIILLFSHGGRFFMSMAKFQRWGSAHPEMLADMEELIYKHVRKVGPHLIFYDEKFEPLKRWLGKKPSSQKTWIISRSSPI